jgi:type IV secretory pathway VirB2 component (pilin)
MTSPPPSSDWQPAPAQLDYQSGSPYGTAPSHVRLIAIFNLISAGLSTTGGVAAIALAVIYAMIPIPRPPGSSTTSEVWFLVIIYSVVGVCALTVAIVKVVAGIKLLRGGINSWGWTLAAGIGGCFEFFWCSIFCILPLAASIYAFVILAQPGTKAYLHSRERATVAPSD